MRARGDIVPVIIDRLTGEVHQAQIFVAVMGASNFTYVEATWTQVQIPVHRGQSFQSIADSVPVIADSF
jgi:transposase